MLFAENWKGTSVGQVCTLIKDLYFWWMMNKQEATFLTLKFLWTIPIFWYQYLLLILVLFFMSDAT